MSERDRVPVGSPRSPSLPLSQPNTGSLLLPFFIGIVALSALLGELPTLPIAIAYAGCSAAAFIMIWAWGGRGHVSGRTVFVLLLILSGFYGLTLGSITVAGISVFPYRILLMLGLIGGISLWLFKGARIGLTHHSLRWYYAFLGIWFAYGLLSLLWARYPANTIHEMLLLGLALVLVVLVVENLSMESGLRHIEWLWIATLSVFLILGMIEIRLGLHLRDKALPLVSRAAQFRPRGPFHNTNDFGTFLALSVPFAMAWAAYGRRLSEYVVGCLLFCFSLYMIHATDSRAAMLAIIVEVLVFIMLVARGRPRRRFALTTGGLAVVAAVVLPGYYVGVIASLKSLMIQLDLGVGSAAVRLDLLRNALSALISSYGFGLGAGNIEPWIAARGGAGQGVSSLHNWWGEMLANYGILVFAGYVLFYLGLIRALLVARRCVPIGWDRRICETLIVALAGFSVASISSSSIMALQVHWLLFAVALAFIHYMRRSGRGVRVS